MKKSLPNTYQDCLNHIYSTYMQAKPQIKHALDCHIRDISIIHKLLDFHNISAKCEKTVKITGSKGKGTVTRLCEAMIRIQHPHQKIAMLISPEELHHTDRMRINGVAITEQEFVRIYKILLPYIHQKSIQFSMDEYFSPSGLFLCIALYWFQEQNVDWTVLETGRGAMFDEVGNIASRTSIVTSILLEHPEYLGDSLESIAHHKLYVAHNSTAVAIGKSVVPHASNIKNTLPEFIIDSFTAYPQWYRENCMVAVAAIAHLLDMDSQLIYDNFKGKNQNVAAAFGISEKWGKTLYYDGAIALPSLDSQFLDTVIKSAKDNNKSIIFLVSLPDEKDIFNMCAVLQQKANVNHVVLQGTRGYLEYTKTLESFKDTVVWQGKYDDVLGFTNFIKNTPTDIIYCIGTQTYIRLVKSALGQ